MAARPAGWLVRVLISLVVIWGLLKFSTPFVELRRLKLEVPALEQESHKLTEENKALRKGLEDLKTPEGLRVEAHKQGWLGSGERRLVFIEPSPSEMGLPEPPATDEPPVFDKMHDWSRRLGEKVAVKLHWRAEPENPS
jgi:hypothetical protein